MAVARQRECSSVVESDGNCIICARKIREACEHIHLTNGVQKNDSEHNDCQAKGETVR